MFASKKNQLMVRRVQVYNQLIIQYPSPLLLEIIAWLGFGHYLFFIYFFVVSDYPDYTAGYNYDGTAIKEEDEEKYRPEKDGTNGSYEGNYSENY